MKYATVRSIGILLAALTGALVYPAMARDPRLAVRMYNANEVVRLQGRAGVQASITFAEDERIENVAIGDSSQWQITPNKRADILFVKPLSARARTNMTVITDRRSYYFDLVANNAALPVYMLRFTYPVEPKTPASEVTLPALTEEEALAMTARVEDAAVDPAKLNFAWKTKGKQQLLPTRIYDDGRSTYLSWSPGQSLPAMQVRSETGEEGPVNFTARDDVIVIDGVPELIVLRAGKDMATLERLPQLAKSSAPASQPADAAQKEGQ